MFIQQGDVLIKSTKGIKGNKLNHLTIAEGEATGHHHSVSCTTTELYQEQRCDILDRNFHVLVVSEPTTLNHQEHGTIEVAPGTYWVVRQREYDGEKERRVID